MVVKASVERGRFVRPMAYSKEAGLFQGDAFAVEVGQYRPDFTYSGRPDGPIGIMGEGVYKKDRYVGKMPEMPSFGQ